MTNPAEGGQTLESPTLISKRCISLESVYASVLPNWKTNRTATLIVNRERKVVCRKRSANARHTTVGRYYFRFCICIYTSAALLWSKVVSGKITRRDYDEKMRRLCGKLLPVT